ncbi:TetR/AcrR family transcriptional regulator [Caldalkalibacillus mannanilyticus]|uniref:TetR/AcrR family transcriptional regulator n=1 Tax=Caldalkalibacillus mannanilyticus TaxID=1418 RepID=UPI000688AAB3|nr:TetR/AcrR family transcriptional regulator [Caldalkalibacillus mannanilyticus]
MEGSIIARKFNDEEKIYLRQKLVTEGKKQFGQLGLKKTSVALLTEAVGIAQGSFYLFYESKEELYFTILEMEEAELRQQLLHSVNLEEKLTKEALKTFLKKGIALIENNPFFQQLYTENVLEIVMRKLPTSRLEQHFQQDSDVFFPIILSWQKNNDLIDHAPDVILSVFRSLIILSFQKK